jgi:hypothetical protein
MFEQKSAQQLARDNGGFSHRLLRYVQLDIEQETLGF